MAELKGTINTRVDQPGENESHNQSAVTSFGLPGYGSIPASMCSCHFNVIVAVYDNLDVYMGINGQISDPVIASSGYDSILVAAATDWNFRRSGDHVTGWPSSAGTWSASIDATDGSASRAPSWAAGKTANQASGLTGRGWYIWNLSCGTPAKTITDGAASTNGLVRIGDLTEFGGSDEGDDGYLYLGGTGTYEINDPVYPDPIRITVPGFLAFLDYYPFAIRKSGRMMSANREGGMTRVRKSGSWRDVRNVARGSGTDDGFYRKSGKWTKAPEIGAK